MPLLACTADGFNAFSELGILATADAAAIFGSDATTAATSPTATPTKNDAGSSGDDDDDDTSTNQADAAPLTLSINGTGATNTSGYLSAACIRASALPQANALHVISVYTSSTGRGGVIPVHVTAAATPTPATLIFTSYDLVTWALTVDPGAQIDHIYVSGYDIYPSSDAGVVASVTGTTAPVDRLPYPLTYAYAWEVNSDEDGDFGSFIRVIRNLAGALETSYQGVYSGQDFTIPYMGNPDGGNQAIESHYEASTTCADPCSVDAGTFGWQQLNPATVADTTAGDSVTDPADASASEVAGTYGKRCGKHYFEIEFTNTTADVSVGVAVAASLTGSPPDLPTLRSTPTRIGVALDLDKARVFYETSAGWVVPNALPGTATNLTDPTIGATNGAQLNIWTSDAVVPVVGFGPGSMAIVRRPPFQFPQPTGYSDDY